MLKFLILIGRSEIRDWNYILQWLSGLSVYRYNESEFLRVSDCLKVRENININNSNKSSENYISTHFLDISCNSGCSNNGKEI